MKKIILLALVTIGVLNAHAQSSGPELGIRTGAGGSTFLNAIDAVLPLNDVNRLHGDLAIGNNILVLDALYEWQFGIGENFSVYPGFGGAAAIFNDGDNDGNSELGVSVLGVIGLEYAIQEIPLTLGIDFRPGIGIINNNGFGSGGGFMIRYRFQ